MYIRTYAHAHAHLSTYFRTALFREQIHAREREKRFWGSCRDLSYPRWNLNSNRRTDTHVYDHVCVYARLPGPFRSLFSRRRSAKVGGLSVGYRKYFPTPRIYRASARKYLKIPSTTREVKGRRGGREMRGRKRERAGGETEALPEGSYKIFHTLINSARGRISRITTRWELGRSIIRSAAFIRGSNEVTSASI